MKLSVPYRYLNALARFCRDGRSRPVLSGILVEATDTDVFLVSTDGIRLGVISMPVEEALCDDTDETGSFIIPKLLVEQLRSLDGDAATAKLKIKGDKVSITMTLPYDHFGCTSFGKLINGNFPAWRGVFTPFSTEPIGTTVVDPVYMRSFGKVGAILQAKGQCRGMVVSRLKPDAYWDKGESPVVFRFTHTPSFVGLLMPMKSDSPDINVNAVATLPGWVRPEVAERWGDRVWIVPPGARIFHLKRQEWIDAPGVGEPSGRGILYRVPVGVESEAAK
ncbi:MAG TPA: hypothetical protein VNQ90_02790 [Chthoniobacteraceae bacterium]|nr:hypothetical protein [Chthoniobacteraceae bacterium]